MLPFSPLEGVMGDVYLPGGFKRECDRCGFEFRHWDTVKEWTGLFVCRECYDPRHPQDYVRGRRNPQRVTDPRPEMADMFIAGSEDVIYTSDGEQVFMPDGEMVTVIV